MTDNIQSQQGKPPFIIARFTSHPADLSLTGFSKPIWDLKDYKEMLLRKKAEEEEELSKADAKVDANGRKYKHITHRMIVLTAKLEALEELGI